MWCRLPILQLRSLKLEGSHDLHKVIQPEGRVGIRTQVCLTLVWAVSWTPAPSQLYSVCFQQSSPPRGLPHDKRAGTLPSRWKLSLKALCNCVSLGTRRHWGILSSNGPPCQVCLPHRPEHGLKTLAWSLATKLISIPINFNVCVHMSPSLFSPWVIFSTLS